MEVSVWTVVLCALPVSPVCPDAEVTGLLLVTEVSGFCVVGALGTTGVALLLSDVVA